MKTYAVLPDLHAPLHDKRALGVVCNVLANTKLAGGVQLGDFADLESVSSHKKKKPSERTLKAEVDGVIRVRKDLESVCKNWTITLGNHEDRIPSFIMDHAPELFEFVDFRSLCGFQNWDVIPFKKHLQIGKVLLMHTINPKLVGINAVRTTGNKAGKSIITGHVHRLQTEYFGKVTGKHYFTHCPGWLGSEKAASYLSQIDVWSQWQTGFSLIHVESSGYVHLHPIPVVDGRCVVNGKVYRG